MSFWRETTLDFRNFKSAYASTIKLFKCLLADFDSPRTHLAHYFAYKNVVIKSLILLEKLKNDLKLASVVWDAIILHDLNEFIFWDNARSFFIKSRKLSLKTKYAARSSLFDTLCHSGNCDLRVLLDWYFWLLVGIELLLNQFWNHIDVLSLL